MAPISTVTMNGLNIFSNGDTVFIDDHRVFPALHVTPAAPVVTRPVDAINDPLPTALFKTFWRLVGNHPYIFLFVAMIITAAIFDAYCDREKFLVDKIKGPTSPT